MLNLITIIRFWLMCEHPFLLISQIEVRFIVYK